MIINVSSIEEIRGAEAIGFHTIAKTGLEVISEATAEECFHLGIKVIIVEPKDTDDHIPEDPVKVGKMIVMLVQQKNIISRLPLSYYAFRVNGEVQRSKKL